MSFQKANLVLYVKYAFIFLILIPYEIFSQGISNLWLTGYACGSRPECGVSATNLFSGFADTIHSNISMSFMETNANISDSLGNLLFYTNGVYIANSLNDTMLNGAGLNPAPYTSQNSNYGLRVKQGNLILPMPGNQSKYYLFHETMYLDSTINDYRPLELFYSIIDMSLDSNRGKVIQKNNLLFSDTLTIGSITGCKNANGRDWWIVFHKATGQRYYEFLLTPNGLQGPFIQDIGYSIQARDWSWQSCFSPDGSKYATVYKKDTFDLMDFDRCSGLFSNCISTEINDSGFTRGIAFSPDSKKLYVTSSNYIYQYSAMSTSLDSSKVLVSTFDKFAEPIPPFYVGYYLAQLGYDGKIYVNSKSTTRWMTVINNPDSIGLACNVLDHGFLLPTINGFTLPNFPNYFLEKKAGTICDSLPLIMNHSDIFRVRNKLNISKPKATSPKTLIKNNPIDNPLEEKSSYQYFLIKTSELLLNK